MRKIVDLIENLNNNEVALYNDKDGEFHATVNKDNAHTYAVGKIMITDECGASGGRPVFNDIKVDVFGAGDGYVYLSKYARDNDIRYLTAEDSYKIPAGGSVSVSHKELTNAENKAYRIANEFYMELAKA